MCCVLQGAGRVCPSSMRDKHHDGSTPSDRGGCNTSLATNDLPLESLWAAGLDEGMGFPQRCYYANHRTIPITPTTPNKNTEQIWHERNTPYRYSLVFHVCLLICMVFTFSFLFIFIFAKKIRAKLCMYMFMCCTCTGRNGSAKNFKNY